MATYLIRPGRSTEKDKSREDYCLNNNLASVGWGSAGDFTDVKSYQEANHPPVPVLGHPEQITVKSGEGFGLDASGSTDPDGDNLSYLWFSYPEAGSYKKLIKMGPPENAHGVYVIAPEVEKNETAHFILRVTDKGKPQLSRYKRVIVNVLPK